MHKALSLMNLQIHHVIADITGVTGIAIVRSIVAGERTPAVLAQHRRGRCRADIPTLEAALTGSYREEHIFALRQALALWDSHQSLIAECDEAISSLLQKLQTVSNRQLPPLQKSRKQRQAKGPKVDLRTPTYHLTGVDLTEIPGVSEYTAASIIAEIGTDMTAWPSAKHFAAWLRTPPRNKISGGHRLSTRTLPTTSRATQLLRMAAVGAGRTQTAIGAFYRRMAARKSKAQAVGATANKLARIIYSMLKTATPFKDIGEDAYTTAQRLRAIKNLRRRAKALGVQLVEQRTEIMEASAIT
jgi:transposase